MTIPEQHQLRIAKKTLLMNDVMATIMGGMTKVEAVRVCLKHGYRYWHYFDNNGQQTIYASPQPLDYGNYIAIAHEGDYIEGTLPVSIVGSLASVNRS